MEQLCPVIVVVRRELIEDVKEALRSIGVAGVSRLRAEAIPDAG